MSESTATAQPGATQPLLRVTDLTVRYGGVVALESVSLRVDEGSIVGLIGPNGAGKTTLVDAMTGFARCSGEILFRGVPLGGLRPHARARQGLARTFQSGAIFDDLTVEENVLIGERHGSGWRSTALTILSGRRPQPRPETRRLMSSLHLEDVTGLRVEQLSEGHRKLVCVAQALASRPALVLLDEPAAGLDSQESAWLGERLAAVRDSGVTIVLVDHDMDLVTRVCDALIVLDFGRVIAAGDPPAVLADERVVSAYLGSAVPGAEYQP
jgi:ABC-type branched-subunit amino acid transport system ATPase component